jgi:hypothetical protein
MTGSDLEFRDRNMANQCAKFDPEPDFKIEFKMGSDFTEENDPSKRNFYPDFKLYAAKMPGCFSTPKTIKFYRQNLILKT